MMKNNIDSNFILLFSLEQTPVHVAIYIENNTKSNTAHCFHEKKEESRKLTLVAT
jgi:hypothetical protein